MFLEVLKVGPHISVTTNWNGEVYMVRESENVNLWLLPMAQAWHNEVVLLLEYGILQVCKTLFIIVGMA